MQLPLPSWSPKRAATSSSHKSRPRALEIVRRKPGGSRALLELLYRGPDLDVAIFPAAMSRPGQLSHAIAVTEPSVRSFSGNANPTNLIIRASSAAEACGVDLYLDQQSLDTTTPAGKLMFQITGAFAEFERLLVHTCRQG